MRKRKDDVDRTRQRIVEAAVELHGTVGPAHTTMSAIAEQAGVQRSTLYRHFPDEEAVFGACSSHWFANHPWPTMPPADVDGEPLERVHAGLLMLYRYYDANREMLWNVFRDFDAMPAFIGELMGSVLAATHSDLLESWPSQDQRETMAAGVAVAIDFRTWTVLDDTGLAPDAGVDLMVRMLRAPTPRST